MNNVKNDFDFSDLLGKKLNAHTGNGWNYGIKIGRTKAQVFRYYTNGHVNTDYEYSKWILLQDLDLSEDDFENIDYLDQDSWKNISYVEEASGALQRLFHTC